jgi:DNA-binding MarR family transcriptional regulator
MNALSNKLGITLAAVSQLVDHLVKRGYVDRKVDLQDRRTKRLSLTEKGLLTMKEANAHATDGCKSWLTPSRLKSKTP